MINLTTRGISIHPPTISLPISAVLAALHSAVPVVLPPCTLSHTLLTCTLPLLLPYKKTLCGFRKALHRQQLPSQRPDQACLVSSRRNKMVNWVQQEYWVQDSQRGRDGWEKVGEVETETRWQGRRSTNSSPYDGVYSPNYHSWDCQNCHCYTWNFA